MKHYFVSALILSCQLVSPAPTYALKLIDGKPVFEERLTGEAYHQRFRQAIQAMPTVEELESSTFPTVGSHINWLNPGHQAEGLGIDPGSVLASLDGRLLWPGWVDWGSRTLPQTLTFVTSSGEPRSVTVQPGTVGINHSPYTRADLAYIRRPGRLKAIDGEVLVGLMMAGKDSELAETAWAHAIAGGYQPDDLSDACAALIAFDQNKAELAETIARQVPPVDADHAYRLLPNDRVRIALASGRFGSILDQPVGFLEQRGINIEQLKAVMDLREAAVQDAPTPSQAAAGMKRIDLMGSIMPINDPAIDSSNPVQFPGLLEGDEFGMNAGQGQFRACYVGFKQPAKDIEVIVRYTLTINAQKTRWANIFQVALLDLEYRRRHNIRADQVRGMNIRKRMTQMEVGVARDIIAETQIHLHFANMTDSIYYYEPKYDLAEPAKLEVRIIKVGGVVDGQINGTTVALSPVREDSDQRGVFFQVVGAGAKVHEFRVSSLE